MSDTPIDKLTIEINAKADSANNAIDSLCKKIDTLTTSISKVDVGKLNSLGNGIKRLGDSLQTMKGVDTRSINSVVNKINSLSAIDTSKFATVSANLHQMANGIQSLGTVSANVASVGELAKNISKLGNKSVQTAITNIPQLATALNGLMTTLSRTPKVSQNVIQMTNALANLTAQGSKVGSASNSIVKGLNRASTSADRSKKSFKGLASAFGKFYANCFLAIRGVKALWKSINSTADYLEAFNYFEVALNKVGGDWAGDWEKYSKKLGVTSAEEYANSFKTRLNESLKGLSGVQISIDANGETGLLTDTGLKNLGLNIKEVTQYASQLASVTNSVGQTGEVTLAAASAFTKLGADMSSLFNVNYSDVMKNLQSGLIGQSRALYKYGIDITNATLQTYAYELGVEKAVSEMTQAEKMQLRMIAILDQSKIAWGDQANTINSLSNSIRQFKNNISEAGQILGQLFVPILSKIMPIVNGVTIAIKRLMVSIAGLFGIKLDLSEFGQGTSNVADEMGSLSDSLDDATSSAEKLKKATTTLGIDELNINSPQTDASGGSSSGASVGGGLDLTDSILKATEEYEKAWQEAYDRMQNKAEKVAKKTEKAFIPIKKLFKDIASDDWFAVGGDFSEIISATLQGLTVGVEELSNSTIFYDIGQRIVDFVCGIEWGKIAWDLSSFLASISNAFTDIPAKLWEGIAQGIADKIFGEGKVKIKIPDWVKEIWSYVNPLGNPVGKIFNFAEWINNDVAPWFTDGTWINVLSGVLTAFERIWEKIVTWWNNTAIVTWWNNHVAPWFTVEKWNTLGENVKNSFEKKWGEIQKWWSGTAIVTWWNNHVAPWFTIKKWTDTLHNIRKSFEEKWMETSNYWKESILKWWNDDVTPWFTVEKWVSSMTGIVEAFKQTFKNAANAAIGIFNKLIDRINEKMHFEWEPIEIAGVEVVPGGSVQLFTIPHIPQFETGGFPEKYSLFMAGENGVPEIVGTSGGRPAVAGGAEITGISNAVYSTSEQELRELREMNDLLRQLLAKDMSVNIGDREIYRANLRGAKASGKMLIV